MPSDRVLVVAALIFWFSYWGLASRTALEERRQAELDWFRADARQDWAAAEAHRSETRATTKALAADVAAGLGLPLILLLVVEIRRVRERRRLTERPPH